MLRKLVLIIAGAFVIGVIGLVLLKDYNADTKACGSAVTGRAKPVGTISFRPGAQEVTVTGDFTVKVDLSDHGSRVEDTKGGGVILKFAPRTNGNTGIRNDGRRTVVLKGGPGNPCANSVSPTRSTDYAGVGTVEVY